MFTNASHADLVKFFGDPFAVPNSRSANVGQQLTVIAWIWARTVKSPNPAFAQVDVPLASTFMLATKAGKDGLIWNDETISGFIEHPDVFMPGTSMISASSGHSPVGLVVTTSIL